MPLSDYTNIVGATAGIVTVGQFFSGVFLCKDIVKQGNTENVQPTPFIGGVGMSLLFLKYAQIINDSNMMTVNIIGIVLNLAYLLCFFVYTEEKMQLVSVITKAAILIGSILGYVSWEAEDKVEFRFGLITTVLMFILISSPLLALGEIMRTKSTACLPFPIILSGTCVSLSWLLYGVCIDDAFMQIQNLVAFLLSAVQLSLFVIYPSTPVKDKKKAS